MTSGRAGARFAASAARAISLMAMVGLAGVSRRRCGFSARRNAAVEARGNFPRELECLRRRRLQKIVNEVLCAAVKGNRVHDDRPGLSTVSIAVMMAAIPELNTRAAWRAGFERHDLVFEDLGVGMVKTRIDEVDLLARLGLDAARHQSKRARRPPDWRTRKWRYEIPRVLRTPRKAAGRSPRVRTSVGGCRVDSPSFRCGMAAPPSDHSVTL